MKVTIAIGLALMALPTLCTNRSPSPTRPRVTEELVVDEPTTTAPGSARTRATLAPPTSTSTTPSQALEVTEPITAHLPHVTTGYVIDYTLEGSQVVLAVTLRAVLNRPEQRPQYIADLTAAKAEALAWLAERGTARLPIRWVPAWAADL